MATPDRECCAPSLRTSRLSLRTARHRTRRRPAPASGVLLQGASNAVPPVRDAFFHARPRSHFAARRPLGAQSIGEAVVPPVHGFAFAFAFGCDFNFAILKACSVPIADRGFDEGPSVARTGIWQAIDRDWLAAYGLPQGVHRALIQIDAGIREVTLGLLPVTPQCVFRSFPARRVLCRPPARKARGLSL